MFSAAIRGEKSFGAEQKIRELKKRIFRLKSLEKRKKMENKILWDNTKIN